MTTKKSKTVRDKRRKYDEVFKTEALRLASESRSTQADAQQLGRTRKASAPSCSTGGNRRNR